MFLFNSNLFIDDKSKLILDNYSKNVLIMFHYILKNSNNIFEATESLVVNDFIFDNDKTIFEILIYINKENITNITKSKLINLSKNKFNHDLTLYIEKIYNTEPRNITYVKSKHNFLEYSRKIKLLHTFEYMKKNIHDQSFDNSIKDFHNEVSSIRGEEQFANKQSQIDTFKDMIHQAVKNKDEGDGQLNGFRTYLTEIDNQTLGLEPASFNVIAARPAMGKTALILSFIANNIMLNPDSDEAMIFFSLEMPAEQLIMRVVSIITKIPLSKMRSGDLTDDEVLKIMETADLVHTSNLLIEDKSSVNIYNIVNKVKKLQSSRKIGMVMIDYIQLVLGQPGLDRRLVVDEISRQLKMMAKDMKIPVIGLSQLNRSLEQRDDKRPKMSDLRESGGIEQDADRIIFIYRDSVYNKNEESKNITEDITEIIFEKQRNGPIGTIYSLFVPQTTYFKNVNSASLEEEQLEHLSKEFIERVSHLPNVEEELFKVKIHKSKGN
jgi:replicative DNA helicase